MKKSLIIILVLVLIIASFLIGFLVSKFYVVYNNPEDNNLIGGCAGVYYPYWGECCENWARENPDRNVPKITCEGNWTIESNECVWKCS